MHMLYLLGVDNEALIAEVEVRNNGQSTMKTNFNHVDDLIHVENVLQVPDSLERNNNNEGPSLVKKPNIPSCWSQGGTTSKQNTDKGVEVDPIGAGSDYRIRSIAKVVMNE